MLVARLLPSIEECHFFCHNVLQYCDHFMDILDAIVFQISLNFILITYPKT
ncbi:Uncharacterised protein [uncultured archaeon]|nr:Uncharacterised protein [uncultured archaeon]